MQNSNSQWAAAHGGGENWQWGDLVTPAGGKTPVDAGLAAAAAFDAQYSAAPPSLGGQPSTQAIPTISAFGAQQPGPQATSGDMNVMYDLLGQGALPQSQFDILMGGGMGQDGLAVVAGAMGGGYPPGATAGGVNMRNSTLSYSTASPPTADYLRSNNAASSSAPTPFSYGTPSFSQPPMHHQQMLNNVHSQSSWSSHTPPYQQHPPHQPAPPKPLPPHPAFQAYPSPPISAQMPLPGRPLIPPHILAPHVDSLDRMYLLQNQISEREAILGAGARGRDPAIMSQLKSQLHLLKAQQESLMAKCNSFVHSNGGDELVGAEVHAYKMQQVGGGAISRPPSQMQSRPPPQAPTFAVSHPPAPPPSSAALPFSLLQSANARAFNNLPTSHAPFAPSPAPTVQPSHPSAIPQSHQLLTLQPGAPTHASLPPSSSIQPHPQQPQQIPRPRPLVQRNSSDSLPPGLRAQMAAARRAQSNQPPLTPATPSVAMGNLNPNTPIITTPAAPGLGGRIGSNEGSRLVAPLPKGRETRSATAILADPTPGMPTLAQLQSQLSKEKFNSILPIVLAKQNIPFASNYTIGQGNYAIDLFQLYQTVMVTGHGGEKVTSESRWPSIAASLSLPASDRDTVPQELAEFYMKILMPFEAVWSTALLAQRNQASAEKSRQKAMNDAVGSTGGGDHSLAKIPSSTSGFGLSNGGARTASSYPGNLEDSAPPPRFHPSRDEIPRADPIEPKSAFGFSDTGFTPDHDSGTVIDMVKTGLNDARQQQEKNRRMDAEAHEKIRASVRAGGQSAPFTPPSPSSWVGSSGSGSLGSGSNLSRRSTVPARKASGRFEELLDVGDGEDGEGRRRKRTKSGEAAMGGESESASLTSAAALNLSPPTIPANASNPTFADPTAPLAVSPPLPSLSLPINDELFPQYLFNSEGGSPPASDTNRTPDLLLAGVVATDQDTPSSSIDLSGLGMGMGLGDWDSGSLGGRLSGELNEWDAGSGLGAFNFEEELASWTAAGPSGGL